MSTGAELEVLLGRARAGIAYLHASGVATGGLSLSAGERWSRARLALTLEKLYAALLAADRAADASDRDSGSFLFHDGGLAALLDELRGAGARGVDLP